MANATPSFPGQTNGSGSATALYLKVFAGEVLGAFTRATKFMDKQIVRTIPNGTSAQFPALGKTTAAYHTAGAEILGSSINGAERVIGIDGLLHSAVFIDNVDEAMSHFEFRSEYAKQCGLALAYTHDANVGQVISLAARASATVTGLSGGSSLTNASALTDADSFVQSVFDAKAALDGKDVPEEDRFVSVNPTLYGLLVNSSSKLVSRDYNPQGNGSIAEGSGIRIAGMPVIWTNQMPSTNITTGPTAYQGDFRYVAGLVWQRGATGTVKLMDVAVESAYDVRRQGTLVVAKYLMGHGILRPECAVEIKTQ